MRRNRAPAVISLLLRIVLPRNECDRIAGELEAEYLEEERSRKRGLTGSLWFWHEGISLMTAYTVARIRGKSTRDISVVLDARRYRRKSKRHFREGDEKGFLMESLWHDIRYALRSLRRDPKYLLTAVLTLAVGIGANTAIFTVLNGVVLKPLHYEEPGQLVRFYQGPLSDPENLEFITGLDFVDARRLSESFQHLACYYDYRQWGLDLTGGDRPRRIITMPVSSEYFTVLDAEPLLGRNFTREEERYDNSNVIISHRLWQQHFDGDPDAIGKSIILDGESWTVIGIMPSDFSEPFGREIDVWLAQSLVPGSPPPGNRFSNNSRDNYYLSAIGRLRPGVTIESARVELDMVVAAIDDENPGRDPWQFRLVPLNEAVIGRVGTMLYVLLAAVGLVLLIACVNVANISLARGLSREKELAIRSALGSSRRRLLRQQLTENAVLAITGGLVGLLLAVWGVKLLLALRPDALPRLNDISFDPSVFLFTAAVSAFTILLFGFFPAVRFSRPEIERSLRETGTTTSTGLRHRRLRGMLVASQVAVALVLLICAALLVQSFMNLRRMDLGFEPANVVTFDLSLPIQAYNVEEPSRRIAFMREFHKKLEALPGVTAAGAVSRLPVTGYYHSWGYAIRSESAAAGETIWHLANIRVIGDRYLDALGINLLKGRHFTESDNLDSPLVVIVSSSLAERYFPGSDPIGEQIWRGEWREIVGVMEDVRTGFREDVPDNIYIPYNQFAHDRPWVMAHVVACEGGTGIMAGAIRGELAGLDPDLVMFNFRTLDEVVGGAVARERFALILMGAFSFVALMLAVLGIYGVLSYAVSQRLHEIGIRIALGAHSRNVRGAIIREGMLFATAGIVAGAGAALVLTRWLSSLVFEISVSDPATFALVALLLSGVAVLACYFPARRATRTDPIEILRSE